MIKNNESINWIPLEKNLVIQKEFFLPSFFHGCGLKSNNPVCTSNLEGLMLKEYGA